MASCVSCGSYIPENQGLSSCSMCYGDIDHGKDGYYRQWAEEQQRQAEQDAYEAEQAAQAEQEAMERDRYEAEREQESNE